MEDVTVVQVAKSLEELHHITLDLREGKVDVWVGRHAREIVVHVWGHHVESRALLALA